jgi:Putative Actinobacterial Holin-X, holin superfamily III
MRQERRQRDEEGMRQAVTTPSIEAGHEGAPDVEPTTQLIREALDETRELVRLEVALAREEIRAELTQAKGAAVALSGAMALAIASFTMFMVAIALAFDLGWLAALVIGLVLSCISGALVLAGYRAIPRHPMVDTKDRIASDLKQLKERIA